MGLALALELKQQFTDSSITLIEKENSLGEHASGRNSGVLHAGFYYSADSLKAQLTRDGCRSLTEYCLDRNIPINQCGKLVVTKNEAELDSLDELFRRAKANDVQVEEVSEQEALAIEPRAKTYQRALFSPTTASVNPRDVMVSLEQDARDAGIQIFSGVAYQKHNGNQLQTSAGTISAGYVINAAGLYADKIARDFGYSQDYTILPFKGLYLYSSETPGALKTNIYPVPLLENPFLGVHFTIAVDGTIKIGPTAIPAFWREHYHGIDNFKLNEFLQIISLETSLMFNSSFNFAGLAVSEMEKFFKSRMVALAQDMASEVKLSDYKVWGKPGIRAQLINLKTRSLEMDFKYEGDKQSFHLLNAVSPAFTCSLSFSKYLVTQISGLLAD